MTQIEPNSELTGEDIPLSATQKVGETINKTENTSQSPDLLDEGESEPYEFNFCTIKIHIVMRPDDGHPEGRIVEITATSHDDLPLLVQVRENSIGAWPNHLQELLQRLASNLPNRKVSAQIRSSVGQPRKQAKPNLQNSANHPVNKGEAGVQIPLF
ncbi:hypothetical protein [Microcoleus sp. Z1_C3]|uniref:hypothetical protein n=1 Tax=unclassified Microcoleus TaxID=2642155 RepID=UPI002FD305FC